jgi:hypothetical protein
MTAERAATDIERKGMKFTFKWDRRGWWNTLSEANGVLTHLASFCRAKSQDGIVIYQLVLGPARVAFGRKNQPRRRK